jgi:uncharacterized protein YbjT (DUF2867 family)
MYVVLGATGHTGSVVAESLLAKGEKVRAVGRSKVRLAALMRRGAEGFEADVTDSAALTRAFEVARGVYFMVPPDLQNPDYRAYQRKVIEAGATALEAAKVRYVVVLSSYGADKESGLGPVSGLHDLETRFSKIPGLNVLFFRAGYFMENLLPQVAVIQNFGIIGGPVRADIPNPMIATHDIGAAAADALLKLDFSGQQTRELLGQRDISYAEAARIIGAAIGKPDLAYVQLPAGQFIQALMAMGTSRNFAEGLIEMTDGINEGRMKPLEPRSAANTTPSSLETFVQEVFVPAYRGGKAANA